MSDLHTRRSLAAFVFVSINGGDNLAYHLRVEPSCNHILVAQVVFDVGLNYRI
jgi:hypothetical protein